ncbi:MAG: hypothetical protein JST39_00755, partial [Bacteroidetes bacterium]|nr:hypothetical protein [Bacteroidota bacterium]
SGAIMLGIAQDPYFGKTTATSFLSMAPSTSAIPDVLFNAAYDSIVVLMKGNKTWYGDTTTVPTFKFRQLTQEIALPDAQYAFYNSSSFPFNPTPLGSRTMNIRPSNGDSVKIKLDDSNGFGANLFGMIRRKSDTLKNNTTFSRVFKGFQLSAENANVIYGFKDSITLRLYYHQTDNFYENKSFDFTLNNNNFQWNNIAYDRSGTPLTQLSAASREVSSTKTNNIGYMQSASGVYLKITFPYLRSLLGRSDYIKIISAQLTLKPIPGSYGYNGRFRMPPQLVASTTDAVNEPGGNLTSNASGTTTTETGNLFIDYQNYSNTAYTYDVTSYLIAQLALTNNYQGNGLLMIPPSGSRNSNLDRLVIGDSKYPDVNARVGLKIYYVSVNK